MTRNLEKVVDGVWRATSRANGDGRHPSPLLGYRGTSAEKDPPVQPAITGANWGGGMSNVKAMWLLASSTDRHRDMLIARYALPWAMCNVDTQPEAVDAMATCSAGADQGSER